MKTSIHFWSYCWIHLRMGTVSDKI